ncbi:hypothetical protein F2P81_012796 [Scophthalmus maximus]|uniref:Uncharacterized protein n=1 Tax=Scophthalmus maximus TaxID=52904 RepID=A0A6A4SSC7_SCOMX|nr:hypothetical protein F2P81_012796 [Scophthalmus maximus]
MFAWMRSVTTTTVARGREMGNRSLAVRHPLYFPPNICLITPRHFLFNILPIDDRKTSADKKDDTLSSPQPSVMRQNDEKTRESGSTTCAIIRSSSQLVGRSGWDLGCRGADDRWGGRCSGTAVGVRRVSVQAAAAAAHRRLWSTNIYI